MSPAFDPDLRRVSVHIDAAVLDVSLPAAVPVATLIPSIIDILDTHHTVDNIAATHIQLSRPGLPALAASTTLAQNEISDGAVLVLSRSSPEPPALRHHDAAEAVSAQLDTTTHPGNRAAARVTGTLAAGCLTVLGLLTSVRNTLNTNITGATPGAAAVAGFAALVFLTIAHRAYRDSATGLTLGLIATAFAAASGFLAVPGAPGAPHVLLAATAAAAMSVLALRVTGCGRVTFTAVACFAAVAAVAALAGIITEAAVPAIGSVSALASVGLLEISPRLSLVLTGLPASSAPPDDLATRAICADKYLTSLFAAFSWSAAVGAVLSDQIALPAVTGALLLLRARAPDRTTMLVFSSSGIATVAKTFAASAARTPHHGPTIVAITALLAGAAIYLGSVGPARQLSPVGHRAVELVECVALAAMVPLTCWICGLFNAVRSLNLIWA